MMIKKEQKTNVHRVFGVAVALLLVIAALFVGSVAAIDVDSADKLVTEIQNLSESNVDITITADISDLTTEQIKKILKSVGTEFTKGGANKFLNVSFNSDKTITVFGDGKTVLVGKGGSVNLSVKDKEFTLNCKSGVSGMLTVGSDVLELKITNDINPSLKINEEIGVVKFIETSAFAKATIDGTEITVSNIKIDNQKVEFGNIKFDTSYEMEIKKLPPNGEFTGSVYLSNVEVKATLSSLYADAKYQSSKLTATGKTKGTLVYDEATIAINNVEGTYGDTTSLTGSATLQDSNLKLTRHIPVPSFVTGAVNLNGKSVVILEDGIMTSGSPSGKITLTGEGSFGKTVADHEKFIVANGYEWKETYSKIVKKQTPTPTTHGGGGGGGSSSWIPSTSTVTPTPTATTTVAPTVIPTVVPTEQPQSPMPFFGILAGLGAAALAGAALRRK